MTTVQMCWQDASRGKVPQRTMEINVTAKKKKKMRNRVNGFLILVRTPGVSNQGDLAHRQTILLNHTSILGGIGHPLHACLRVSANISQVSQVYPTTVLFCLCTTYVGDRPFCTRHSVMLAQCSCAPSSRSHAATLTASGELFA